MFASVGYLVKKDLRFDAVAASITEVSLAFATITLITGSIWGRIIWGIWWTWDARLTSYFICWLLYVGYLMLRRAIDDPTTRARLCAVLSIFACVDIVIVWKSIEWFRTQHPGPVLSIRNGGGMAPGMEAPIWWNLLASTDARRGSDADPHAAGSHASARLIRCAATRTHFEGDCHGSKLHIHVLRLHGRLASGNHIRDLHRAAGEVSFARNWIG